jgi:hypothetical protein
MKLRAHRCVRTASGSDPINAQLAWMIPSLPLRVLTRRLRGSTAAASTQAFGVNSAFNAEVFVAPPHAVAMEFDLFRERRSPDASGLG